MKNHVIYDLVNSMKSHTLTAFRENQRMHIPYIIDTKDDFYDTDEILHSGECKIFPVDKYHYNDRLYSARLAEDNPNECIGVLRVANIPYKSFYKRINKTSILASMECMIKSNYVVPFMLFIDNKFVNSNDIDILYDAGETFLLLHGRKYNPHDLALAKRFTIIILPYDCDYIGTQTDEIFKIYYDALCEYIQKSLHMNDKNKLVIDIPDAETVYKYNNIYYSIGSWMYTQNKLYLLGLLNDERINMLKKIELIYKEYNDSGICVHTYTTRFNALDRDNYDNEILQNYYLLNMEDYKKKELIRFNDDGCLDDEGDNVYYILSDKIYHDHYTSSDRNFYKNYDNIDNILQRENYLVFENGILDIDQHLELEFGNGVYIDNEKENKYDLFVFYHMDSERVFQTPAYKFDHNYVIQRLRNWYEENPGKIIAIAIDEDGNEIENNAEELYPNSEYFLIVDATRTNYDDDLYVLYPKEEQDLYHPDDREFEIDKVEPMSNYIYLSNDSTNDRIKVIYKDALGYTFISTEDYVEYIGDIDVLSSKFTTVNLDNITPDDTDIANIYPLNDYNTYSNDSGKYLTSGRIEDFYAIYLDGQDNPAYINERYRLLALLLDTDGALTGKYLSGLEYDLFTTVNGTNANEIFRYGLEADIIENIDDIDSDNMAFRFTLVDPNFDDIVELIIMKDEKQYAIINQNNTGMEDCIIDGKFKLKYDVTCNYNIVGTEIIKIYSREIEFTGNKIDNVFLLMQSDVARGIIFINEKMYIISDGVIEPICDTVLGAESYDKDLDDIDEIIMIDKYYKKQIVNYIAQYCTQCLDFVLSNKLLYEQNMENAVDKIIDYDVSIFNRIIPTNIESSYFTGKDINEYLDKPFEAETRRGLKIPRCKYYNHETYCMVFVNGELIPEYSEMIVYHNYFFISIKDDFRDTDEIEILYFKYCDNNEINFKLNESVFINKFSQDVRNYTQAVIPNVVKQNIDGTVEGITEKYGFNYHGYRYIDLGAMLLYDMDGKFSAINKMRTSLFSNVIRNEDLKIFEKYPENMLSYPELVKPTHDIAFNVSFTEVDETGDVGVYMYPEAMRNMNDKFTAVSKRKFIYQRLYTDQKAYRFKLSTRFRYCDNRKQYMLFINGRRIYDDSFFITIPNFGNPFWGMYLYITKFVKPEDRVELFYVPEEMEDINIKRKVKLKEDGYIEFNKMNLDVPIDNRLYMLFINGKKINPNNIAMISSSMLRMKEDTFTLMPLVVNKTYTDTVEKVTDYMHSRSLCTYDKLINSINNNKYLGKDELDKLFGIYTKMSDPENNMIRPNVARIAAINEIVRDFWVTSGYPYHEKPFVYDYETDSIFYKDTEGNFIIPALDANQIINIPKNDIHLLYFNAIPDEHFYERGSCISDLEFEWEYSESIFDDIKPEVYSQNINDEYINTNERTYKWPHDINMDTDFLFTGIIGGNTVQDLYSIKFVDPIYYGAIDESSFAPFRNNPIFNVDDLVVLVHKDDRVDYFSEIYKTIDEKYTIGDYYKNYYLVDDLVFIESNCNPRILPSADISELYFMIPENSKDLMDGTMDIINENGVEWIFTNYNYRDLSETTYLSEMDDYDLVYLDQLDLLDKDNFNKLLEMDRYMISAYDSDGTLCINENMYSLNYYNKPYSFISDEETTDGGLVLIAPFDNDMLFDGTSEFSDKTARIIPLDEFDISTNRYGNHYYTGYPNTFVNEQDLHAIIPDNRELLMSDEIENDPDLVTLEDVFAKYKYIPSEFLWMKDVQDLMDQYMRLTHRYFYEDSTDKFMRWLSAIFIDHDSTLINEFLEANPNLTMDDLRFSRRADVIKMILDNTPVDEGGTQEGTYRAFLRMIEENKYLPHKFIMDPNNNYITRKINIDYEDLLFIKDNGDTLNGGYKITNLNGETLYHTNEELNDMIKVMHKLLQDTPEVDFRYAMGNRKYLLFAVPEYYINNGNNITFKLQDFADPEFINSIADGNSPLYTSGYNDDGELELLENMSMIYIGSTDYTNEYGVTTKYAVWRSDGYFTKLNDDTGVRIKTIYK